MKKRKSQNRRRPRHRHRKISRDSERKLKTARIFLASLSGGVHIPAKKSHLASALEDPRLKWNKARRKFLQEFYKQTVFDDPPRTVIAEGSIGLEYDIENFLEFAQRLLNSRSSLTILDVKQATRIWPSAITLLVSQVEWLRLAAASQVIIRSNDPSDLKVGSYLSHCGFYEYVGRQSQSRLGNDYSANEVVKIRTEQDKAKTKERHFEIMALVNEHSSLAENEKELFDCTVLSEILGNVTEHGVASKYAGWFVLAQNHPTTGILFCKKASH